MWEDYYLRWNLNSMYKAKCQRLLRRGVFLVGCIFLAVVFGNADNASGQTGIKTVEAVGTATVYKKDVNTAKQQAIANGLVCVLDKVITEILSAEQLTQNFHKIDKIIFRQTGQFIIDYKVLTESISKKDYRVLIQAKVSIERLKNRLETSGVMKARKRKFQNIELVVQGTRNLSHFFNFRKGLKEIPKVKAIQVSDMQGDTANLMVTFEGNSKELSDLLVLKQFENFSIRIFEISKSKLRVEIVPS